MMDASYLFAKIFHDLKYENLPQDVVEITKRLILDQLGVALAGSSKPGVKELLELFTEWDGKGEATILCYGYKIPAIHAAQLNATMGHAQDYDDTHEDAMMHPSVVNVPTALAMAEYTGGLNGREFITAVTLGIDMMCRLGLATRPGTNLMTTGWHFTTLYGFMAAAGAFAISMPARPLTSTRSEPAAGFNHRLVQSGKTSFSEFTTINFAWFWLTARRMILPTTG